MKFRHHHMILSGLLVLVLRLPVSACPELSFPGSAQPGDPVTPFAYSLKIEPAVMHVRLVYTPVMPDSSSFQYGNLFYGGMTDLLKGMKNLTASVPLRLDTANRIITVFHRNQQPVTISWDITDTHRPEQKVVGEMFRPILTDQYFFSLSHTLFLKPLLEKKLADSLWMSVRLDNDPAFPMFFSFAPEIQSGGIARVKLDEGMDALVTGASDLCLVKRKLEGVCNYIVLRISEKNQYDLPLFLNFFDRYMAAMTNFWGKPRGDYYSLVASPFLDITYHDISGTAYHAGFHVKYSGDTLLSGETRIMTIAHEIMHRYIGAGVVSMGENQQWFDEGFTDYTTWYLLTQSGIMPREKLPEWIGKTYGELAENPFRDTPNDSVMVHFWENHSYEKLPCGACSQLTWTRAHKWGNRGSDRTFRDFMHKLNAMADQKKDILTPDDFLFIASVSA
ncbi:MAG: hypothetical protein U0T82_01235 [Bacteroidales bacterium]